MWCTRKAKAWQTTTRRTAAMYPNVFGRSVVSILATWKGIALPRIYLKSQLVPSSLPLLLLFFLLPFSHFLVSILLHLTPSTTISWILPGLLVRSPVQFDTWRVYVSYHSRHKGSHALEKEVKVNENILEIISCRLYWLLTSGNILITTTGIPTKVIWIWRRLGEICKTTNDN